jgi:hypothetical protein
MRRSSRHHRERSSVSASHVPSTSACRHAVVRDSCHPRACASSHGVSFCAVTSAWPTPVATIASRSAVATSSFHTSVIAAPSASHARIRRCSLSYRQPATPAAVATTSAAAPTPLRWRARVRPRASAVSSASIEGHRRSASFANPRSTIRRSHGGTRAPGGGSASSPARIFAASSGSVSPTNGRHPCSASHSVTQNEN